MMFKFILKKKRSALGIHQNKNADNNDPCVQNISNSIALGKTSELSRLYFNSMVSR